MESGLSAAEREPVGSKYLDLHLDAVGKLGTNDVLGRAALEATWRFSKKWSAYAEAGVLTDRSWDAGAGLRWRF